MVILFFALQQGPKILREELSYRLTFLLVLVRVLQRNRTDRMYVCVCGGGQEGSEREINLGNWFRQL